MLLSVNNLSVSRGGVSLFKGLNFTLSSGQFISLTGGNGVSVTEEKAKQVLLQVESSR